MRQKLGQHFLINTEAITAIVDALHIKKGDVIIEIGPGHGELTGHLLASQASHIIAIEKDKRLAQSLKNVIQDLKFKIHEGDALKMLPLITHQLPAESYKLVGNIPYYLTGYLFRAIGELERKPACIVFTIQKEVAERLCAVPPRMNKLAAAVQVWGNPKIIKTLKQNDFNPPPQVDSAIIMLKIKNNELGITETQNYYTTVHALFQQPRKTILNNIHFGFPKISKEKLLEIFATTDINPTDRPQNLSLEKIKELSLMLLA